MEWLKRTRYCVYFVVVSCISNYLTTGVADEKHFDSEANAATPPEVLIVLGAGGTPEYTEEFRQAGQAWKSILSQRRVVVIGEQDNAANGSNEIAANSSEEEEKSFDRSMVFEHLRSMVEMADKLDPTQVRWIVLIGHGTSDPSGTKFNLTGPDIEAKEIASALGQAPGRWVIVNAFSSSGPVIHALSGKDRIVITATKSGSEQNYSRFAKYLATAIGDASSDLNHDSNISVLEAFLAASKRVSKFYADEGRLATEQALLDDNGDKRGTPASFFRGLKPAKAPADGLQADGELARRVVLHKLLSENSATVEMEAKADQIEELIAKLRQKKDKMPPVEYQEELEKLLVDMAEALGVK